jgi:hypothetical protein
MTAKLSLVFFCALSLSALGVAANENQPEQQRQENHVIPPYSTELYNSTAQFEYEFEWQSGKIIANP